MPFLPLSRKPGGIHERAFWIVLAVILLAAAWLRFIPVEWDMLQLAHPDERYIVWVAETIHRPNSLHEALDPDRSPMNPFRWPPEEGKAVGEERIYAYGHFPLYLLVAAAHGVKAAAPYLMRLFPPSHRGFFLSVAPHLTEYNYMPLVGRPVVAMFDMGTLFLIAMLARKLYGNATALLAAAFLAFTVLHIQLAHFATTDLVMTFWTTWTVFWSVAYLRSRRSVHLVLAGIGYGLGVSSKFSAIVAALPLFLAVLLVHQKDWRRTIEWSLLALAVALAAFAVTSPYAILDFRHYAMNIADQGAMVRGTWQVPYTQQFAGTLPYLYQGEQLLLWGMGVPLALFAFAGLGWQTWKLVRLRMSGEEVVILAWVLPVALATGSFYVKFLRYMAPITPFLALYAAWFSVEVFNLLRRRWRYAWGAVVALSLVATGLWALAFHNIYDQPHTWVQASIWIYEHVPDGSTILTEDWDDALPLTLDASGIRIEKPKYNFLEIPSYDDDTPEKRDKIISLLEDTDYISIASRRIYRTVERLPDRYPLMNLYYRRLFSGELGFEKVAEFSQYPHLGSLMIRDTNADESFVVYDHPHPMIFKKIRWLSGEEMKQLLTPTEWGVGKRGRVPGLARTVPSPTVRPPASWNAPAERDPLLAALTWWLLLLAMGLSTWPLTVMVFRNMKDRGWAFARLTGWLLIAYVNWLLASLGLATNSIPVLLAAWVLLLAANLAIWRVWGTEVRDAWSRSRRLILTEEAIWLASFVFFLVLRILNPDLWQPWFGGEKFMELAFLHATIRTPHFPPYDPYFAGGVLNYYYYGLYLVGVLSRLSGIYPRVSFNLAIPALFAFTVVGTFSLGYTLGRGRRLLAGALAAFMTAIWGNLAGFVQLVTALRAARGHLALPYSYWATSRVIPHTINEFPYWSFLFADLHPHLIAIPFTVLYLALTWEVWRGNDSLFISTAVGFVLGMLAASNTWNLPVAVGFLLLVVLLRTLRTRVSAGLLFCVVLSLVISAVLYMPFSLHYKPIGSHGVGFAPGGNPPWPWFQVWGLFVLLAGCYLLGLSLPARPLRSGGHLLGSLLALAAGGTAIVLAKDGYMVAALLLLLWFVSAVALWRWRNHERAFVAVLIFSAFGILFFLEFFYLRDFLDGGDWYRMNTLFKFGIQVWVLLGVGVGVGTAEMFRLDRRWEPGKQAVFRSVIWISLAMGSVFFLVGTPARVTERFPGARPAIGTLDGMAYMSVGVYRWKDVTIDLRYDYEAINWLWEHVGDTPVVAEAPLDYYRAGALRVSSFTGFPTLLGQHEPEQRTWGEVLPRQQDATELFGTANPGVAREIIHELGVRYIYLGQIERGAYPHGVKKFGVLVRSGELEIVYRNPGVTIYRVR